MSLYLVAGIDDPVDRFMITLPHQISGAGIADAPYRS